MGQRSPERELEQAEAYLQGRILPHWRAWPEHYREASDSLGWSLEKFMDPDQVEETREFIGRVEDANGGFQLRVGFALGRMFAAGQELTEAAVCQAVESAGGLPGRALADQVESELASYPAQLGDVLANWMLAGQAVGNWQGIQ